jgi:hypothetical protein
MTALTWDQVGERLYETGVDHGVLYIPDGAGNYNDGVAWNGLTTVTESPSGAESNPQYADNIKYLNLVSAEQFGATIEAFTYPPEFEQFDGVASPTPGVSIGQQTRKPFGLSYRTLIGNDTQGTDRGYKLHLVYGATAAPSERAYGTVNDSPEAMSLSWELTTTPVEVPGYKPASTLTITSTEVDAGALSTLEDRLYGTAGTDPSLPLPAEVIAMFTGTVAEVTPTVPTFDDATNTITIPTVTGVQYTINGEVVTGTVVIDQDTLVRADPTAGYKFPEVVDNVWMYSYSAG